MFVAWFVVYLLLSGQWRRASSYRIRCVVGEPGDPMLNVVSVAFMVYHAITFFHAAPRAMVVRLGRTRVPRRSSAGHYAAWVAAAVLVALLGGDKLMIRRHPEPLLWMLFSAGGVLSGMLMPILLLVFGVAVPLAGWSLPTSGCSAVRKSARGLALFGLCACRCFTGRIDSVIPSMTVCRSNI